jgi:hypothetical protein
MILDKYIQGEEGWAAAYQKGGRKRIWIKVKFSDDHTIYLSEYNQWLTLKSEIENLNLRIIEIGLRFRTHEINVDTSQADAVYIVRSVMAQFGGETIHFYTTGIYDGNIVSKTRWHVPALVEESKDEDDIEDCFEEALIYNGKKA